MSMYNLFQNFRILFSDTIKLFSSFCFHWTHGLFISEAVMYRFKTNDIKTLTYEPLKH